MLEHLAGGVVQHAPTSAGLAQTVPAQRSWRRRCCRLSGAAEARRRRDGGARGPGLAARRHIARRGRGAGRPSTGGVGGGAVVALTGLPAEVRLARARVHVVHSTRGSSWRRPRVPTKRLACRQLFRTPIVSHSGDVFRVAVRAEAVLTSFERVRAPHVGALRARLRRAGMIREAIMAPTFAGGAFHSRPAILLPQLVWMTTRRSCPSSAACTPGSRRRWSTAPCRRSTSRRRPWWTWWLLDREPQYRSCRVVVDLAEPEARRRRDGGTRDR